MDPGAGAPEAPARPEASRPLSTQPVRLAVIGLGQMGRPMSGHLAKAGYRIRACDASADTLA